MSALSEKLALLAPDDNEVLTLARALAMDDFTNRARKIAELATILRDRAGDFAENAALGDVKAELDRLKGELDGFEKGLLHLRDLQSKAAAARVRAQLAATQAEQAGQGRP